MCIKCLQLVKIFVKIEPLNTDFLDIYIHFEDAR